MPDCTILCGDAVQQLMTLAPNSVDCVVTSPPYYKARRYGVDGEYGQERTYEDYIAVMVSVMQQVKRVLKPTGTLWLVVGDRYGSGDPKRTVTPTIPSKSLALIPYRLAQSMIDDGWILRNVVIWDKTNHLPHPVKDRLSNSYEPVFFFVRSGRYFFNLDSIRIPQRSGPSLVSWDSLDNTTAYHRGDEVGLDVSAARTYAIRTRKKSKLYTGHPLGKNPGDVWPISTVGEYDNAMMKDDFQHWATFPESLITPMILAGCPEHGTVLDPFCGIGTTLVVALRTNRNAIGIDLDPRCVETTKRRTGDVLAQESLFARPARPVVRQGFLPIDDLYTHTPVEEIGSPT